MGQARRDEHWACGGEDCAEYPWHAAFEAAVETVQEEAASVRALVDDDDSACNARELRRQRLHALEWVLAQLDTLRRWDG